MADSVKGAINQHKAVAMGRTVKGVPNQATKAGIPKLPAQKGAK